MRISFREEQVTINSDVILKGTMAIPEVEAEKLPAVLIVNGSGGADRDGNIKKPVINGDIYKKLAYLVTELGFITLRYDKRAVGESQGDAVKSGMNDLINDIVSNIKFLQNHPKVDKDKIIVIGHSEGCILSTIANTINPVGGLVLIAGAGTNIWGPMKYQNHQIIEEIKHAKGLKGMLLRLVLKEKTLEKQQQDLFDKMVNSTGDTVRIKGKKVPARWFREHFKYSSEEILKALGNASCPILAITGDKDVQANVEDLKKVGKLGKDNIKCVIIENMDHMIKEFSGEKTVLGVMKQYKAEMSKPVHPQFKAVLEDWLINVK
jgi:pimeloyl-ACP methyl ester carboxylesterase